MSYLDRLKVKISENAPDCEATKPTKAPFVPFVAPLTAPSRQIPAEIRILINRVMELRDCPESDREAFAQDWRNDPEGIERVLRHLAEFYGGLSQQEAERLAPKDQTLGAQDGKNK